ncbi:hypothetical protein ACWGTO_33140 [Mesorhizobium sp. PL10]
MLSAICEGRVGAVFAIEVSRLARNGRDWHTLIEFCGRTTPSKRSAIAGHERDNERTRTVAPAGPFDGSSEAEGTPGRTLLHGRRRLCECRP